MRPHRFAAFFVGTVLLCCAAGAGAEEKAATPTAAAATPTRVADAGGPKIAGTPIAASRDPVVVAARLSKQLHQQAADATKKAVELAENKNTLVQARRQMLLATGSLYNSSTQLKRAAKKEAELALIRQASAEQKERIVASQETEEEKASVARQAKALLAYAETEGDMAAAMNDFASKQEGLSKKTEAAAKDGDQKTFAAIHKEVEALLAEGKKMYDDVIRDRLKLDTMLQ